LLAQPVDGHLRVREEVAIEEMDDSQMVILSPEPYRVDERLTIEIPGGSRRRLNVKVQESRPAVVADGAIRHRLKLSIEQHGHNDIQHEGQDL
jgi:hypothetical protein